MVAIDYTGDGKKDIITSSPSNNSTTAPSWLAFFNGAGAGTFAAALGLTLSTSGERIMKAADVNNDGNEDIVVAEYRSASLARFARLSVFTLPNNSSIPSPVHYVLSGYPTDICITDLNNDGSKDIVVCIWATGQIVTLLNNGSGSFGTPSYVATCTNPIGIAIGDFDADGNTDVVSGNSNKNYSIHMGQGNGSFDPKQTFSGTSVTEVRVTGDFNGDGKIDIVFSSDQYAPGYGVEIMQGKGNGTFNTGYVVNTSSYVDRAFAADLNGDGKLDIVGNQSDKAVVLLNKTQPNSVSIKENKLSNLSLNVSSLGNERVLQSNEEMNLTITDLTGRVLLTTQLKVNNEFTATLRDLCIGVYVISGTNPSGTLTRKIVIE